MKKSEFVDQLYKLLGFEIGDALSKYDIYRIVQICEDLGMLPPAKGSICLPESARNEEILELLDSLFGCMEWDEEHN